MEIWVLRAPTPQHRESTQRHRPTPRRGMPRQGEAEVPKLYPSGTPRHSKAMPQRRPMIYIAVLRRGVATVHKGQKFWIFVAKV